MTEYKSDTLTDCAKCDQKIVRAVQTDNWNHVRDDGHGTLTYIPTKHYGVPRGEVTCPHCGDVRNHPVEAPDVCPDYEHFLADSGEVAAR